MAGEDLLSNMMFLQYLSGAGSALSAGEPVGPALNNITQQNIQNQNFAKLMKHFLSADGTKGAFDSKGLTMSVPKETALFSSILGGDSPFKVDQSLVPSNTGAADTKLSNFAGLYGSGMRSIGNANPFVSSQLELNPADLAGLNPEMIATAVGLKFKQDEIANQRVQQVLDNLYKGQLIKESEQRVSASEENTKREAPIFTIPNTNIQLNAKQYLDWQKMNQEDKTAAVKNYEFAKSEGFKGSFTDFQDTAKTNNQKDYDSAVLGGYKGSFNQWLLDMRRAGATNINLGQKLEEKKAMSELEGQLYFNDPKWTGEVNKHLSSESVQNDIFRSNDPKLVKTKETIKFIEDKISAGGGNVTDVKFDKDGKTMIWTVKWPSGDTKTIKYQVR